LAVAAAVGALACGNGNKPVTNGGGGGTDPVVDAGPVDEPKPTAGYTVLADGQYMPLSLVADESHVYWTILGTEPNSHVDGEVNRVPVGGGAVESIATDQTAPDELILGDDEVFWANGSADTIMVWAKSSEQTPAILSSQQRGASDLMIDGAYLYWVKGTIVKSAIVRRSFDEGSVATVHVVDEHPMVVESDADNFYWASTLGEIWSLDKNGQDAPTKLARQTEDDRALVMGIATSDTHVFWIVRGRLLESDSIVRVAKSGGARTTVVTARGDIAHIRVVDGTLYYSDSGTPRAADDDGPNQGRIMRVDVDGGDPVMIAAVEEREIVGMSVVGDTIYFSDGGTLDFDTGDWASDARILSVPASARIDVASR
jgi:hypothetical protein